MHNFIKLSLLTVYINILKLDVLCLLKTYLNSNISSYDENSEVQGYNLSRKDHPCNSIIIYLLHKVIIHCIYFIYFDVSIICSYCIAFLLLRIFFVEYLQQYIYFNLRVAGSSCKFLSFYPSSKELRDNVKTFAKHVLWHSYKK